MSIPSIDLFDAMNAAEAAMIAGDYDLDLCRVCDAARDAYYAALSAQRSIWNALPRNDARSSAETNAEDTGGTAENELFWVDIALGTYEMNINSGDYNADGSAR